MKSKYSRFIKIITCYILINFLSTIIMPTIILALTSGPSSPEFSSFTPVSSNNLVNSFTGDFAYNIPVIDVPGPNGSGYSMSLSYNSGVTMEQEASWVGFGWTLNPGSLNRTLRGFPDEYNGEEIDYYNKSRPNWTATATSIKGLEIFSADENSIGFNSSSIHRINNYTGYQHVSSVGVNVLGAVGINATTSVDGTTYDPFISPLALAQQIKDRKNFKLRGEMKEMQKGDDYNKSKYKSKLTQNIGMSAGNVSVGLDLKNNSFVISPVGDTPAPFVYNKYKGFSTTWSISGQFNPGPVPIGLEIGKTGAFSYRMNYPHERIAAYGYANTNFEANVNENMAMDYYVEKNKPFQKVDNFIGIPYSNYDVFNISGEGVIGGYRTYLPNIGHFKPRNIKSETTNMNFGFEFMYGINTGVGLDFGNSNQETKVSKWIDAKKGVASGENIQRFNNDLGGHVTYDDTEVKVVKTSQVGSSPGNMASIPGKENIETYNRKHSGSSICINELKKSNHKWEGTKVINKEGVSFYYEEPLLIKNETSISVDVNNNYKKRNKYLAFGPLKLSKVNGKYSFKKDKTGLNSDIHKTISGQINTNEYPKSFLLTRIEKPNYLDVDNITGPSDGDIGGWTKFSYRKIYGKGKERWYRYRMPYNGLLYQQGAISDIKDDVGSVQTGEKDIKYLKTIETKTHIAYFVTNKTNLDNPYLKGSQKDRLDGVGAVDLTEEYDPASYFGENNEQNEYAKLEYLEKIVIFAKNPKGSKEKLHEGQKPLKTVRFEYDYSLVRNVANNVNSNYNYLNQNIYNSSNSGKLTLRKVWFEYEGVVSAQISPYIFNYNYPKVSEGSILHKYFKEYENILAGNFQNPDYEPYALNGWGGVTPNSKIRRSHNISWIDQSSFVEETQAYDPAAYHMKSIKLPSGGIMYIQYEPKDYAYVQDRDVMAMANVSVYNGENGNNSTPNYSSDDKYLINVKSLGADPANYKEIELLASKIKEYFKPNNNDTEIAEEEEEQRKEKKVYYKFLFGLLNNSPSINNAHSEYITGYAGYKSIEIIEKSQNEYGLVLTVKGKAKTNKDGAVEISPRRACREFVAHYRQGKLAGHDGVEPTYEKKYDDIIAKLSNYNYKSVKKAIKNEVVKPVIKSLIFGFENNKYYNFSENDSRIGNFINEELSFIKLPMLRNKIAGGARVKRILLYDKGLEDNDNIVLGSEYKYILEDGLTSSGVATNEPVSIREENPLVNFLPNKGQSAWDRLITGENLSQNEGPIGEALLPDASIGYSRVVKENIHKGATGNGFTIENYYTAKDYPFDKLYVRDEASGEEGWKDKYDFNGRANDHTSLNENQDQFSLNTPFFNYSYAKQWCTQGYRFVQTQMHGLSRSILTYSGNYNSFNEDKKNYYLVTGQEYEYFEPGEKIKVVGFDENLKLFTDNIVPGKEMDIARESKKISDISINFSVEVDISFTIPIAIFVTPWVTFGISENHLHSHSTNKVISYPSILKATTNTVEGISSRSENLAFDKLTGDPVLVKSTDSYFGSKYTDKESNKYYNLSIPASWVYKDMGQKSISDDYKNSNNSNQLSSKVAQFVVFEKNPLNEEWLQQPQNLISATIKEYKNNWWSIIKNQKNVLDEYSIKEDVGIDVKNKYNKRWLPWKNYVYNSKQENANYAFNKGIFNLEHPISWNNIDNDKNWVKTSEVNMYSPDGNVIEESDALGIKSSVLYSKTYQNNVPVMVSNNSDYGSIYFNDFEGLNYQSNNSHSGSKAAIAGQLNNVFNNVFVTPNLKKDGAIVMFWVDGDYPDISFKIVNNAIPIGDLVSEGGQGIDNSSANEDDQLPTTEIPIEKIATIDGWTLCQCVIDPIEHLSTVQIKEGEPYVEMRGELNLPREALIDDIRLQPLNSSSNCFVYDTENLRLLAQFDDQHFGTYFQYNQEGKLVRQIVETERGKHTIQENSYNIKTIKRFDNE